MKLVSSVAAFLLLSSAATYADTPDILGSVSKDSVQVMTKDDAANIRGEYRNCSLSRLGVWLCGPDYLSKYKLDTSVRGRAKVEYRGTTVKRFLFSQSLYYVSR